MRDTRDCTNQIVDEQAKKAFNGTFEEVLRNGARRMLQAALEHEIAEHVKKYSPMVMEDGCQQVVRNGYHKERVVTTGLGGIEIQQPRAYDRKSKESFVSRLLPKYMRRVPSIDNLVPVLYLRGISTGDVQGALEALLGEEARGLSATNVVRLKQVWEQEYKDWNKRDLSGKKYVYFWVDGIYFNVRLDEERQCILIIIGATEDGQKELVAIRDGYRESKQSWSEILRDVKARGLKYAPHLIIGDGALGIWSAVNEVFPDARHQRCWVHKTANILDKMPRSAQGNAKTMIHDMYMAETKEDALKAYDLFMHTYGAKYPKACECLEKDKEVLFTFYDFPAEHWTHIRTTNPIESTFATVRLRTNKTKGCGSRIATLTMVFKLVQAAEKHWYRLRGFKLLSLVMQGKEFVDGILKAA